MTAFVTRPARVDDVPRLQAIENDAGRRYETYEATRFCGALSDRSDEEHRFAREHGLALVAEMAGVPVGFVLAVPLDGRAHILEIAVAMNRQGAGCGRKLIAAAEDWAVRAGCREMTLTTFRDVAWNAPFYARLGYDILDVGADRPGLGGIIADEIAAGIHAAPRVAMRKILPAGYGLNGTYIIRQERREEFPHIRQLIGAAFQTARYAEGDEQDFVERLRGSQSCLPELALVLEEDGRLIGHIMLTQVSIKTAAGPFPILLLACVAVAAEYRNRGIGSALIEAALDRASRDGHLAAILVGDPAYYARLGFLPAVRFGIADENGAEPAHVLLRELVPGALRDAAGSVTLPS